MSGLEVEGVETFETVKGGLNGLMVGEVTSVEKHPDADRLRLTKVNVGGAELLNIVCGAPNVAIGQKVIVATIGAKLFPTSGEPFEIKKSKIRGAVSEGMICAEDEIGLSGNHDAIMVLPENLTPGMPAADYFKPYTDAILDVNITANRGDAMSHIGVARDVVAWLNVHKNANATLNIPQANVSTKPLSLIDVKIENEKACTRYSGLVIENISVKSSPDWLQNKLKAVGINPINNIVDITNYVMLEWGQPLHAFDADKIKGNKIVVKTLPRDSNFLALDGKEIKLHQDDLMICDEDGGMCIAGVYGGFNSGITDTTKRMFLESATFEPTFVRKTMQRHNLRTDAATRFEKTTDPDGTVNALKRAAALIVELGGGTVASEIVDVYPNVKAAKVVSLSYEKLNAVAGVDVPRKTADDILTTLGFKEVKRLNDLVEWEVPGYKTDVAIAEDLIEEVLRIWGFENIPLSQSFKASLPQPMHGDAKRSLLEKTFNFLAANAFNEVQNNSLSSAAQTIKLWPQLEANIIPLLSYSNAGLDSLRVEMLWPLLQTVRYNINRRQLDLKLFEYGKVYYKHDGAYKESEKLTLLLTGKHNVEHWHDKQANADFFHLKGLVEALLKLSGHYEANYDNTEKDELLDNAWALKNKWLRFGKVKQNILDLADIKQTVWYAEIDVLSWTAATVNVKTQFEPQSKFPSVRRDLAMLLPENVTFESIEDVAKKFGSKQLRGIQLFDVFKDKNKLGDGVKSYAVSFTFRDDNKTLEEADIDKRMTVLTEQLEQQLNARIRRD